MNTTNKELQNWVDQVAKLTNPTAVHWCNGSNQEYQNFIAQMLESGDLLKLNAETFPTVTCIDRIRQMSLELNT